MLKLITIMIIIIIITLILINYITIFWVIFVDIIYRLQNFYYYPSYY